MVKLSLDKWAAIAEIIGTVAVVVSLIIVAVTIKQNTAVMQAANDNFIYELQYARVRDIVSSPGLASIYVKRNRNEELTEEEKERFYWDKVQELGTWEIAYTRHRDGLYSAQQWEAWNNYYVEAFIDQFPKETWAEVRNWYAEDFRSHVDTYYLRQE